MIETTIAYKLNQDHKPENQPKGTYRYGLNGVVSKDSISAIQTEKGDNVLYTLQGNIIGVIPIGNDSVYFTDQNNIYLNNTLIIHNDNFNFKNPITGTHRVVRGCENIIYWNEVDNPDRYMNITDTTVHKNNGAWDNDSFLFTPCISTPNIKTKVLTSGGSLNEGVYYFMVEYLDANENVIYKSPLSIDYTPIEKNSSSSIEITVSNIEADYIRITVFRYLTDQYTFDSHTIGRILPIEGDNVTYVYSAFNPGAGDVLLTADTIPITPYSSSYVSTQVQKRLLRANLIENTYDYSEYQRAASKIRTRYIIKQAPKTEYHQTLRGGQVYFPAIHYIHKDGSISNAFPLVNRNKRLSDEELITTAIPTETTFNYIFKDFNVIGNNRLRCNYNFSNYPSSYELHLTTFDLVDNQDITIVQSNPDPNTVQWDFPNPVVTVNFTLDIVVNGAIIETIEFNFFGANPPEEYYGTATFSEAIQYEKWKVQSTSSSTQLVEPLDAFIDSGLCGYYETEQKYNNPRFYECKEEDYWGVNFEGTQLTGQNIRGFVIPDYLLYDEDYIYPKGLYFDKIEYPNDNVVGHFFSISCLDEANSNIQDKGLLFPFGAVGNTDEGRYLHNVDGNTYPQPISTFNFVSPKFLVNDEVSSAQYIVEEGFITETLSEITENNDDIFNASLPYDDLELYQKEHALNNFVQTNDTVVPLIDSKKLLTRSRFEDLENLSHSNNFNLLETSLPLDVSANKYIKYVSLKNVSTVYPNIYAIEFRRFTDVNKNYSFNGDHFLTRFDFTNISWVNVANRNFGQTITFDDTTVKVEFELFKNVYVESEVNTSLRSQGDVPCDYFYDSTIEPFEFIRNKVIEPDGTRNRVRDSVCKFWTGYNNSLSTIQKINRYVTLPPSYNFCSPCNGEYPNRIIYSERSFNEDLSDNYRVFLPNNYIDIPSDSGRITGIDYKENKIIVRTENSCYFITPNPQQLQTSESTVFIGTGDFLSLPEQELNVSPIAYAGQQDKMDSIVTEYGLIWVDKIRGKIFNLNNNLDILSNDGMMSYFQNNLNLEQLRLGYDAYNERLLLTHRQFTISYSFLTRGWIHFHSYLPSFYGYSNNHLYSINDNKVYIHNSDTRQFRGKDAPFIIEYTITDKYTFKPDSIHYYSVSESIDITFDQILAYNHNQSTELIDLTYLEDYSIFDSHYVIESNRNYKVSPLYDSSDGNLFTFNEANSIDKVSIVQPISEVLQGNFRGKHISIRLFFNNPNNSLSFYYLDTFKHYLIR